MARLVVTYEADGTRIMGLTFRGVLYTLTQPKPEDGMRRSLEQCFNYQVVEETGPISEDLDEILEVLSFDQDPFDTEDLIQRLNNSE